MTFNEEYIVKVNYQKDDGYWVIGEVVDVSVPVEHGVNEKNNHNRAANLVQSQFVNCEVVSVKYV